MTTDWFRSIVVLGAAVLVVVGMTFGLAALIVPGPGVGSQPDPDGSAGPSAGAAESQQAGVPSGVGGTLAVTGDREGTFTLTRDSVEGSYALVGSDGRIDFGGQPVEVTQASYDGLAFFPDPGDCTITPGQTDTATGIGLAELVCTDLADIRDNGVISLAGTIGLPIDRLIGRELAAPGGSVTVGDETWTFPEAFIVTWGSPAIAGRDECNMQLIDEAQAAILCFTYDAETHRVGLIDVGHDGETGTVPEGACSLDRTELGKPNPRDVTIELTIECPAVEVPGLGTVPIDGTLVVDELGYPF